jgi:hypothetical protein
MSELVSQVREGRDGDLTKIVDFLYVGNTYSSQNERVLKELGISHILCVKDRKVNHPQG